MALLAHTFYFCWVLRHPKKHKYGVFLMQIAEDCRCGG